MPMRKVNLHLMSCEHKEIIALDDAKPVKYLFKDILEAGTPALNEKVKEMQSAHTGPSVMILFCNGQQLANSSEETVPPEMKPLSRVACFPKEDIDNIPPSLQLYIPKQHYPPAAKTVDSKKPTSKQANQKECCVIA